MEGSAHGDDACGEGRDLPASRHPHLLPELRDVDTAEDADAVAALAPDGRFAAAVRSFLSRRLEA